MVPEELLVQNFIAKISQYNFFGQNSKKDCPTITHNADLISFIKMRAQLFPWRSKQNT